MRPGDARWRWLAENRCVPKRQFLTKDAAERFLAMRSERGYSRDAQSAYECPICGLWHTTHQRESEWPM